MRQLMIVFIVCAACLSAIQAKKDKKAGIFMLKVKGKGMQNMYANNYGGGYGYGGQQGGYGGQQGGYGGQQGGYGGQQSGYGGQYGSSQASYGSQPTIIPVYYPVMVPSYHHQQSEHVGGYADSALGYGQTAGRNIGITIYPAQTPGDYQPSNNFMAGYNAPPMYGGGFASSVGNGYGNSIGSSYNSGGY